MNLTNEDIKKVLQVITHDNCVACDNWRDCLYNPEICKCPYYLAKRTVLDFYDLGNEEDDESEEEN